MTLAQAAPRLGLSGVKPSYLRRLVAERALPLRKRRYSATLHEFYLTAHFVKDTKGSKATRGRFEWHIEDWRVIQHEREQKLRLAGRGDRRRDAASIAQELKAVGL